MDIDFETLDVYTRYKLMASLIVPRPIALVTTLGVDGTINAAPFSMFNMLGEDPPTLFLSINRVGKNGAMKDTATHILARREFVVHLCDEPIAAAMHACGDALPPNESELVHAGLTPVPSRKVAPPRIAEAPVAFECRLSETLESPSRFVFIGEVLQLWARDGLVDTERWRVRLQDYHPVGRFGASFYTTTCERFSIAADPASARSTPIDEI